MIRWRFGSGTGRRWWGGGASSTAQARSSGTAGPASGGGGAAITEILDTYDLRADEESWTREAVEDDRVSFRARAEGLIADVIGPTLRAIGEEVLARGHHWSVEERVDIERQPAVACVFWPKGDPMSSGSGSVLTFRCLFPDRVSTTARLDRQGSTADPPTRSHLASDLSESLVRREVARFMAQVFETAAA